MYSQFLDYLLSSSHSGHFINSSINSEKLNQVCIRQHVLSCLSLVFHWINACCIEVFYLWASISIVWGECATCVGDVAYGDELNFSAVDNLDRAIRASGKFGGVAGVFAGAHNE